MDDTATEPPARNKMPTGDANPNSKAARRIRAAEFEALTADRDRLQGELDAIRDAETDLDEQRGTLTAERMRKVLGQRPELDKGPTEKVLREMLTNKPGEFIKQMEDRERNERGVATMEAENARLREENKALVEKYAPPTVKDEGTDRALALIKRCLADFETQEESKRIALCPTCGRGKDWKPTN